MALERCDDESLFFRDIDKALSDLSSDYNDFFGSWRIWYMEDLNEDPKKLAANLRKMAKTR